MRHRLDIHAAFGRGDDGDAAHRAIDQEREIKLAFDVAALLDKNFLDLFALRAGLVGDQFFAEHRRGILAHGLRVLRELHSTGLTTASGVNLRFHHTQTTAQLSGSGLGFFRSGGDFPAEHGHPIFAQDFFGLILVDVHVPPSGSEAERAVLGAEC